MQGLRVLELRVYILRPYHSPISLSPSDSHVEDEEVDQLVLKDHITHRYLCQYQNVTVKLTC